MSVDTIRKWEGIDDWLYNKIAEPSIAAQGSLIRRTILFLVKLWWRQRIANYTKSAYMQPTCFFRTISLPCAAIDGSKKMIAKPIIIPTVPTNTKALFLFVTYPSLRKVKERVLLCLTVRVIILLLVVHYRIAHLHMIIWRELNYVP